MPIVAWSDAFKLNIDQFDQHHQHLFFLLNKTYDLFVDDEPEHHLASVLDELLDYATYHFTAEEEWMKVNSYPERQEHALQHEYFIKRINEISTSFVRNDTAVSLELLQFLQGWLVEHILKRDMEYAEFITART